jgi:hypothetical protein
MSQGQEVQEVASGNWTVGIGNFGGHFLSFENMGIFRGKSVEKRGIFRVLLINPSLNLSKRKADVVI